MTPPVVLVLVEGAATETRPVPPKPDSWVKLLPVVAGTHRSSSSSTAGRVRRGALGTSRRALRAKEVVRRPERKCFHRLIAILSLNLGQSHPAPRAGGAAA